MGREVRGLFACFSYWSAAAAAAAVARLQLLLFTERSYSITTRPSNLVCTVRNLTGLIRSKEEQGTNIERMEVQVRIHRLPHIVMLAEAAGMLSVQPNVQHLKSQLAWCDVGKWHKEPDLTNIRMYVETSFTSRCPYAPKDNIYTRPHKWDDSLQFLSFIWTSSRPERLKILSESSSTP